MWDLETLVELNDRAADAGCQGRPQREALRTILAREGCPRYYLETALPPEDECGCNSVVE